MGAPHPVDLADRLEVDRRGGVGIAIAQRRADERGQRNDHVMIRDHLPHQGGVTGVTADDLEGRVGAEMEEGRLAEHEAVDHGHPVAGRQEPFAEDRTEVTGSAGDENLVTHLEDTPRAGKGWWGMIAEGGQPILSKRSAFRVEQIALRPRRTGLEVWLRQTFQASWLMRRIWLPLLDVA